MIAVGTAFSGGREASVTGRSDQSCKTCSGPCVFVVEPGEGLRRSMALLLGYYGYDVREHASAEAAIEGLRACAVACVVAGLVRGELDGLALVRTLRAMAWSGPAIVICPELTDAIRQDARSLGEVTLLPRAHAEDRLIQAIQKITPSSVS